MKTMVEAQGKAFASLGILGSNSVDLGKCGVRADFNAGALPNESQQNVTSSMPVASQDARSKDIQCPECSSSKVFRNGVTCSNFDVKIQRYVCRSCSRRFSDPDDLKQAKQVADSYLP